MQNAVYLILTQLWYQHQTYNSKLNLAIQTIEDYSAKYVSF